jgi:hypothetical protein
MKLRKEITIECGDLNWKGQALTPRSAFQKARYSVLPKIPTLGIIARFRIGTGQWFYQTPEGILGSAQSLKRLLRMKVQPKEYSGRFTP